MHILHSYMYTYSYCLSISNAYLRIFLFYRDYFSRSKDDKALVVSDQMIGHYQVTKLTAAQDEYEEEITTFGYAVVGTKNVIKL